jgi:hypothetical protein
VTQTFDAIVIEIDVRHGIGRVRNEFNEDVIQLSREFREPVDTDRRGVARYVELASPVCRRAKSGELGSAVHLKCHSALSRIPEHLAGHTVGGIVVRVYRTLDLVLRGIVTENDVVEGINQKAYIREDGYRH